MTEILNSSFKLIIEKFVLGIPNLIMAIILAFLGFMVAKIVKKIVIRLLQAVKIDKLGDMFNEIDFVSKNNINVKVSSIIGGFIYYILILIFLIAATDVLQMEALSNLVKSTIEFIPNLIVAIAILIIGILIADKLRVLIQSTCESLGIPSGKVIASFIFYFVFITIFVMALSQASIDTAFLSQNISIIIAGVVLAFSIGYGFASKDIISNYIASFSTKGKYKIGDSITIGDSSGIIVDLDKTSVIIESDNHKIIIPINKLINENVKILK